MTWHHPALAARTIDSLDKELAALRGALDKIRQLANHPENDSRAITEIYYIATMARRQS